MVSTNYDGKAIPETATWTAIEGDFPTTTNNSNNHSSLTETYKYYYLCGLGI
jgi:hypothetical protein